MNSDSFTGEWGFGFGDEPMNWRDTLSKEDRNNKHLMGILEHFNELVGEPTNTDVELIKEALIVCYPYQIKNGITSMKTSKKHSAKFRRFSYIYKQLINGMYETRKTVRANKNNISKENANKKKINNQTDVGIKTIGMSRQDIIDTLDNAEINGEAFDFNIFR